MPRNKQSFKGRIFGLREFYRIIDLAMYSVTKQRKGLALIDRNFRSHIMLAVTEVNGCKYCNYLHTKQALASGSSEEQLAALAGGEYGNVEALQVPALLFAQHYADTNGDYDQTTYEEIVREYGDTKAAGILGTVRMIMFGNANGNALTMVSDRFKGIRYKGSRIPNDFAVLLAPVVLLPVLLIRNLFPRPNINSGGKTTARDPNIC